MKAVIAGDVNTEVHVSGGDLTINRVQDCEPILEDAKARHKEGIHGSSEMRHAARLPLVLIEKYCNDKGISFQEWSNNKAHIRAMLNDPALSHFRIWNGRVS